MDFCSKFFEFIFALVSNILGNIFLCEGRLRPHEPPGSWELRPPNHLVLEYYWLAFLIQACKNILSPRHKIQFYLNLKKSIFFLHIIQNIAHLLGRQIFTYLWRWGRGGGGHVALQDRAVFSSLNLNFSRIKFNI